MALDKSRCLSFLFLILLSFTASCGSNEVDEAFIDKSFLEKEPCAPPCWYGLELNQSSEEDIYTTLRQLPFVEKNSIREWGTVWNDDENAKEIFYKCVYSQRPKENTCGGLLLSKNKLKEVWMSVNYDLSFFMSTELFGYPEYISHVPIGVEAVGCTVSLYWPDKQILVRSDTKKACPALYEQEQGFKLDSSTNVTFVMYTAYNNFYSESIGEWPYYPWAGFAEADEE